jgi:hypothetical protein
VASDLQKRTWGIGLAAGVLLALAATAAGQSTQPVWYPPMSLYGRPVSQPYFEFPNWARYSHCRPAPLAWGFDPFPEYGPRDCTCEDVPTVNCPGDFVAHRPSRLYGWADFAPATLDYADDVEIARTPPIDLGMGEFAPGLTVLDSGDLEFEFDSGGRYTVGAVLFDTCYRLEASFWGHYQWDDAAAVFDEDSETQTLLSNGFGNAIVPILDENSLVEIAGESRMLSGEANLLYWIDMPPGGLDVSLMVGARYIRIDDAFSLFATNVGGIDIAEVTARNELYCLQIGIRTDWLIHSRMWIAFDLKGAICTNNIDFDSTFNGSDDSFDRERTSWLGDLVLAANFQLTPTCVARIGYQALFLEGLVLAAENIQVNDAIPMDPAAQLDDDGRLVYHGPIIGIMGVW